MGIFRRMVTLKGVYGRRRVSALLDSGSSVSFVREDIARSIAAVDELREPKKFETAAGELIVELEGYFTLKFRVELRSCSVYVAPRLTEEFILGADLLQELRVVLDLAHDKVRVLG